jgi:hypothetical protein
VQSRSTRTAEGRRAAHTLTEEDKHAARTRPAEDQTCKPPGGLVVRLPGGQQSDRRVMQHCTFGALWCCSAAQRTLYRSASSVRVCRTDSRMRQSVWAAASPKQVRLAYHLSGSFYPRIPIVNVSIPTYQPARCPASRFCSGVYRSSKTLLVCVSILEGCLTPVIWPRELLLTYMT